ncbi:MAG: tRNA modification GTPase [Planctomycetota bacterium]|nr:tRNA modification GTPase [Planctomycetota bacterium]
MSTIAAIATPPGGGRRAVIRLSGPRALELGRETCRFAAENALSRRGAWRGRFHDGVGEQPVLALAMPGPRSFTGEDVLELHLVGSPPLVAAALARLVALGAELARPGEFTRRAFESGRIDLSRAEGVLALVEAESDSERRAAAELCFGGLGKRLEALRESLLDLRVLCEASLDFDEADTGHVPLEELVERGERVRAALEEALGWERRRTRRGGAPRIVLAGAPNAGKSTLFNALTGSRAIVSDVAGTTRDALVAPWVVAGVPCELVDTAGLSADFASGPDGHAQRFAKAEHEAADLVLRVCDAREAPPEHLPPRELLVRARCDLAQGPVGGPGVAVSAVTGSGLAELERAVAQALWLQPASGVARELGERHVAALEHARERLDEALALARARGPLDLVAEALRAALERLDEIEGHASPEDLLDRIFARFCIGK